MKPTLTLATSFTILCAIAAMWSCDSSEPPQAEAPAVSVQVGTGLVAPTPSEVEPRHYDGLHNVVAFSADVLSGSVPEGKAGFATLREMGVRTIISVDGAAPDVDLAEAEGLRYVHLPIGYNGMDEARKLELARAIRDLPHPVYVHCHHGKHRSAAAAAVGLVSLGTISNDEAQARMKISGTSPKYTGLYGCVALASPVDAATLDAASNEFPKIYKTTGFVQAMVEIDHIFAHLKAIEKAGWKTPADHPDLVPVAEAGRLADVFRYLMDDEHIKQESEEFIRWIQLNGIEATTLEDAIVREASPETLSQMLGQIDSTCNACHVKYRN